LARISKFLDEHPFQEEPKEHIRFVNYRSRINGMTVLHYAAQFVNTQLMADLIKTRGVDATLVNNMGMTALHTLAQLRTLPHKSSSHPTAVGFLPPDESIKFDPLKAKKMTMAKMLLEVTIKKRKKDDFPEPILAKPFMRDYYGRFACDLLPEDHMDLRYEFRGKIPDIDFGKHKEKAKESVVGKPATPVHKTSIFESIFGSKNDSSSSSSKQRALNQVSLGIPSSVGVSRTLPQLNRSTSLAKKSSVTGMGSSQRRPLSHQFSSNSSGTTSTSIASPSRKSGAVVINSPSTPFNAQSLQADCIQEE